MRGLFGAAGAGRGLSPMLKAGPTRGQLRGCVAGRI